jgi:Mitochondrial ribosomal protein (VAR1)
MYNNDTFRTIKPLIFTKNLKDNCKTTPYNKIISTLGTMKYFPTANQEWFNSIYTYDNNYIKNMIIANKILGRLIKSYFNLHFNNKLIANKRIITRFRRLATNKIFVSKAELKHTSSKVIITLYVYDEEKRILANRIKRIETILFSSSSKFLFDSLEKKNLLSLKDKLNIIKHEKENISFKTLLEELKFSISSEIKLEINNLITIKNLKNNKEKELEIKNLEKNLDDLLNIIVNCKNNSLSHKYYENLYDKFFCKTLLEKEIITIAYYKLLLSLNKSKFEDKFLLNLKPLISKIYNKEVELNIVNLKAIYLNSDIFTQAISLKLKNRNNGLLKVLRSFLYMVKLPKINAIRERFGYINPKNLWVNLARNLKINYLFYNNKDSLNQLLSGLLQNSNFVKELEQYGGNKYSNNINTNNLLNCVLNSLKYKSMGGVRLEAKGRLTRRFTASRSVFKIKWKGSLKNIDSSYRGLSSVILRGYIKSNVQYSMINSKTRNGAFGLKGWISGK